MKRVNSFSLLQDVVQQNNTLIEEMLYLIIMIVGKLRMCLIHFLRFCLMVWNEHSLLLCQIHFYFECFVVLESSLV